MELLVDVPPFLHPLLHWVFQMLAAVTTCWNNLLVYLETLPPQIAQILHIPRNALLPITAIVLVFWPVLLSLVFALASASTWIVWLFTSIVFGLLQLAYVTYQFFMIACDIVGLSMLKTYSMLRSQCLLIVDALRGTVTTGKSRRRLWRKLVEEADNYETFLKIRIDTKDKSQVVLKNNNNKKTGASVDTALPPPLSMSKSKSFSVEDTPSPRRLTRNRSFSNEAAIESRLYGGTVDPVVSEELGERTVDLLATTTDRLREARRLAHEELDAGDEMSTSSVLANSNTLVYLLSGVLKRNHLRLDDFAVENARSIAISGQYGLTNESRKLIRDYYEEVEAGLDWIADSPLVSEHSLAKEGVNGTKNQMISGLERQNELQERITLVRKMKQNMGRTALMLSGGGAQAMYHLGVIRALIESKHYNDIKVISGTSGGSITAGMCAIMTPEEMYKDVCVPTVSTDYKLTGEQKKRNIRWFPSVTEMAAYWLKNKLMVDSAMFRETCEFYFSDITFEEAFEKTGKHVCITVSASRASGDTAQRLLLNHISTPHVTIASAVAASCALPGVMAPAKLIAKNSNGILEPFEVDGVEWIDGSVQADLPFQRIATLFAVSSFIVSQTNFHVVPLLNKAHHPSQKTMYWKLFQAIEWDVRSRALKLSRLGLFPKFFGQDISKVFKQRYHGNLTIVPRFTTMQTFGLKALSNPTKKDMEGYLKYGQMAVWPYLNAIRDMIRLEKALDACLSRLEDRIRSVAPEVDWSAHDDIESIASGSGIFPSSNRMKIVGRPPIGLALRDRDSDKMRRKVDSLQEENRMLRKQLEEMKMKLTESESGADESTKERVPSLSDGSEGVIWNFVLGRKASN